MRILWLPASGNYPAAISIFVSGFDQCQVLIVTGMGTITMASVGQTLTHFSQPWQGSVITVCISLLAPMMASTEHSLMQRVQPMHLSSKM